MQDSRGIEAGNRVGDSLRSAVGDVVAGKTDHADAGLGDRHQVFGRRPWRGDITLELRSAIRMRHLEMADRKVRRLESGGDARQPVTGSRLVQNQVAGHDNR